MTESELFKKIAGWGEAFRFSHCSTSHHLLGETILKKGVEGGGALRQLSCGFLFCQIKKNLNL